MEEETAALKVHESPTRNERTTAVGSGVAASCVASGGLLGRAPARWRRVGILHGTGCEAQGRAAAKHGWSGQVAPWRAVLSRGRAPGERAGKKRESRVGQRREEQGKGEPGGVSRAKEEGGFSPLAAARGEPRGRGLGLGARFMGQNGPARIRLGCFFLFFSFSKFEIPIQIIIKFIIIQTKIIYK
jgi:hypothetical protein